MSITQERLQNKIPGCPHFTWSEFLWLPTWEVYVFPPRTIFENIIETAGKLELIREFLGGYPLTLTSGWRPELYNEVIGGSPESAHKDGKAGDFKHAVYSSSQVRQRLEPKLEDFEIRMENLPSAGWVHIDTKPVRYERFFKP